MQNRKSWASIQARSKVTEIYESIKYSKTKQNYKGKRGIIKENIGTFQEDKISL